MKWVTLYLLRTAWDVSSEHDNNILCESDHLHYLTIRLGLFKKSWRFLKATIENLRFDIFFVCKQASKDFEF